MAFTATHAWYGGAALAAVGVLGAGYLVLVSPQLTNASDITTQTASVTQGNQREQMQIALLKKQYADLPTLDGQVAAIRTKLPSTPEEPVLLRQLSAVAAINGVTLQSVQFQPPTAMGAAGGGGAATSVQAPGVLSQIGLGLTIQGSFVQTRAFLTAIETMPRAVLITGLDVTRQGDTGSTYLLASNITARTFMAGDTNAAPTTTSGAAGSTTTAAGSTGTPAS